MLIVFLTLTFSGVHLIQKIPVSLLPDIDIPRVLIHVSYPNMPAEVMEQNIVNNIRKSLSNVNKLKEIETRSSNHTGTLQLTFEQGIQMDLVIIDLNERMDKISSSLPPDMDRPIITRINTSDIPIVRIQVIPKSGEEAREISDLADKVLRRRLEQLDGVSIVDINGLQRSVISIKPNEAALSALNLNKMAVASAIRNANQELGILTAKNGHYRYFVKMENAIESLEGIKKTSLILKGGLSVKLENLAEIAIEPSPISGYHLCNNRSGLVITIQKQPNSQMNKLMPLVRKLVNQFKTDYPQVDFSLTQDQSFLLDAGTDNLKQDLIYGGILTVLLLLAFMGDWRLALMMSINIPISLVITFSLFSILGISFNIISLSGLALGVGMMIDNSIVVIDSIVRKRSEGESAMESSVNGTSEVVVPVLSQVLTTVAVYLPLILLSGLAGALVYDQAIGLTLCLFVSLLVAFILTPVLFKIFLHQQKKRIKDDTRLYRVIEKRYSIMISYILEHKRFFFLSTIVLMPIGFIIMAYLPIQALPEIEKKESLLRLDWNEPIDAAENKRRIEALFNNIPKNYLSYEADIGIKQFLLLQENSSIQEADIYYNCITEDTKIKTDLSVRNWIGQNYPSAKLKIIDAPNAFTQLFESAGPYLEARFKPISVNDQATSWSNLLTKLKENINIPYTYGDGFVKETGISILPDNFKMNLYKISKGDLEASMKQLFGVYEVSQIKRYGQVTPIRLSSDKSSLSDKLMTKVTGNAGISIPLNELVTLVTEEREKFITSDRSGTYRAIHFPKFSGRIGKLEKKLQIIAAKNGFIVDFTGRYYQDRAQLNKLVLIFIIVIGLLYLILAIQYENLVLPIVVMLTIPLGLTGGMILLWLSLGSIDMMAGIGFIVILGLIVDDPILKVETMNRLWKKHAIDTATDKENAMKNMIHEAGRICLKPLLMVSLTTSIALLPILFIPGLGNSLQKPLAIVIIGGLTIGTFFTTWFIPLAYWYVTKYFTKSLKK